MHSYIRIDTYAGLLYDQCNRVAMPVPMMKSLRFKICTTRQRKRRGRTPPVPVQSTSNICNASSKQRRRQR